MQRMAEVLRSMTSLNSPTVASPSSPFEIPTEEPSFASSSSNNSAEGSNNRDEIDFVTYESLGRSENQQENQLENMDSGVDENSINYSDDRTEPLPRRNRQDSEQSSNGFSILRFVTVHRNLFALLFYSHLTLFIRDSLTSDEQSFGDGIADEDDMELSYPDMLYQPSAKMKYHGHRNSRYGLLNSLFATLLICVIIFFSIGRR